MVFIYPDRQISRRMQIRIKDFMVQGRDLLQILYTDFLGSSSSVWNTKLAPFDQSILKDTSIKIIIFKDYYIGGDYCR